SVMVVLLTSILTYGVRNRGCLSFIITNYSINISLIASLAASLGATHESSIAHQLVRRLIQSLNMYIRAGIGVISC
ncbi:hypothetical protein, partial [Paenibacillus odorifer]|uniref:hypothetical protein n=1 Tax=Paenibacillus odorifer TaxID=189426 RepID=UPI001C4CED81